MDQVSGLDLILGAADEWSMNVWWVSVSANVISVIVLCVCMSMCVSVWYVSMCDWVYKCESVVGECVWWVSAYKCECGVNVCVWDV